MGKRTAFDADSKATPEGRHLKRQRVENSVERGSPRPAFTTTEEVTSPRQLQKALVFEQGAAQGFRKGIIPCDLQSTLVNLYRPHSIQVIPRFHTLHDR